MHRPVRLVAKKSHTFRSTLDRSPTLNVALTRVLNAIDARRHSDHARRTFAPIAAKLKGFRCRTGPYPIQSSKSPGLVCTFCLNISTEM